MTQEIARNREDINTLGEEGEVELCRLWAGLDYGEEVHWRIILGIWLATKWVLHGWGLSINLSVTTNLMNYQFNIYW